VLAFDYRYLGENGGQPRQIAPLGKQRADLQSAIEFARTLPDVDRTKVAIWGFWGSRHRCRWSIVALRGVSRAFGV